VGDPYSRDVIGRLRYRPVERRCAEACAIGVDQAEHDLVSAADVVPSAEKTSAPNNVSGAGNPVNLRMRFRLRAKG
jgi:hypothetical protein